jgi:hypothetical protein
MLIVNKGAGTFLFMLTQVFLQNSLVASSCYYMHSNHARRSDQYSPFALLHLPVVLVVQDGQDQLLVLIQVLHSSGSKRISMFKHFSRCMSLSSQTTKCNKKNQSSLQQFADKRPTRSLGCSCSLFSNQLVSRSICSTTDKHGSSSPMICLGDSMIMIRLVSP